MTAGENVAPRRIFRGRDIHTKFGRRDDAAEKPYPRHGTPRRISRDATALAVRRVLRLRRVSAVRRLWVPHREGLHPVLREYRVR
jgi:hypothetical protein